MFLVYLHTYRYPRGLVDLLKDFYIFVINNRLAEIVVVVILDCVQVMVIFVACGFVGGKL